MSGRSRSSSHVAGLLVAMASLLALSLPSALLAGNDYAPYEKALAPAALASTTPGGPLSVAAAIPTTTTAAAPAPKTSATAQKQAATGAPAPERKRAAGPVPANDELAAATVIGAFPFGATVDTTGATAATGGSYPDPDMGAGGGANSNTVWFRFTAGGEGYVRADTLGSDHDTVLAAFTGSSGIFTRLASNDDASGTKQSRISFLVHFGQTYYLEAASFGAVPSGGQLRLSADFSSDRFGPPAHDALGNARVITGPHYSDSADTLDATLDSGGVPDPDMGAGAQTNGNTVWYRFSAPGDGIVRVSSAGSDYDTVLAAFTGPSGTLSLIASNDDAAGSAQSEITFAVQSGAVYYVEAASWGPDPGGGLLRLEVDLPGAPAPTATRVPTQTATPVLTAVPGATTTPTATPAGPQRIELHAGWNWFSIATLRGLSTAGRDPVPTARMQDFWGFAIWSGRQAPPGTVVEAFSPRGDLVGNFTVTTAGYFGYMRVYGQDPPPDAATPSATPLPSAVPGMLPGEEITFRINGYPARSDPSPVVWTGSFDPVQVKLVALEGLPVETVLESIAGKYDYVLGEDGTYAASAPYPGANQLTELGPGRGYFLRMKQPAQLVIEGERLPEDRPIDLAAGWRWIGYLPPAWQEVPEVLFSVEGSYDYLLGETGTYAPDAYPFLNTLARMEPGKGYLIRMTKEGTLVYQSPVR